MTKGELYRKVFLILKERVSVGLTAEEKRLLKVLDPANPDSYIDKFFEDNPDLYRFISILSR